MCIIKLMYDSRKDMRWSGLKVGIIISSALGILFLTVMFAGGLEELFVKRSDVYAIFDDVRGLREGAPVWFAGLEVGSVKSITLTADQGVIVRMSIKEEYMKFLKEDSEATILTLGLLGDKYVELSGGSASGKPLMAGATIRGTVQAEFKDLAETSQASLQRLTEFIKHLERFIRDLEEGEGTLAMLIKDPAVYRNLKSGSEAFSEALQSINRGEGSLGKALKDDRLYQQLLEGTQKLKAFADRLNTSEGTLHLLIEERGLYDRLDRTARSLEEFTEKLNTSEGTLRQLVEDRTLYDNLNLSLKQLSLTLEEINSGKGLLGALVKDAQLRAELQETIRQLNSLIEDIKENPKKYFKFSLF